MKLGEVIGRMLSADAVFVHATGEGTISGEQRAEEYVSYRGSSAVERSDGLVQISTRAGSKTISQGRVLYVGPPKNGGRLGITDGLLHPAKLYIWGRAGEDWRLDDVASTTNESSNELKITVVHCESGELGSITVDLTTCRLRHLAVDDTDWTITSLTEDLTTDISTDFLSSSSVAEILTNHQT